MNLWQVDIYPAEGQPDALGVQAELGARELGISERLRIRGSYGFLLQGDLDGSSAFRVAREYLADPLAQRVETAVVGDPSLSKKSGATLLHVLFKSGVMDPVAQSTLHMLRGLGVSADEVRTFRKYWVEGEDAKDKGVIDRLAARVLSNDSIEQVVVGPLQLDRLTLGSPYSLRLSKVPIDGLSDDQLMHLSKTGQLYFTLPEMQTIQAHYRELGREPTDIELETIAQTWSEHCSHKTLGGRIEYRDENGVRRFTSMLKETIFAATKQIRQELADQD